MTEISKNLLTYIINNKWILLVSSFFIGWKLFLISIFFRHEFSKSSEALEYIRYIDSINTCSHVIFCKQFLFSLDGYFGFVHLSYRVFLGSIGHLLNIDSFSVFHLSFYIGILMLLPVLIIFLKSIETDKKLIAFLLLFLTLYNGGGSHGFWWVVPDFFASLLIFIFFIVIFNTYKHWKLMLFILIPIGFYTHGIFVYLMTTAIFFCIIYSFFIKKIDATMVKKVTFAFFILAIFYIPTSYHLGGIPYGPENFIKNSNVVTSSTQLFIEEPSPTSPIKNEKNYYSKEYFEHLFPGFHTVKERYFDFIFLESIFGIVLFIYILSILLFYKQYKILSLYLSALTFTVISFINENADRSLPFIWPMTFLLYAYGAWFSFKLTDALLKNRIANIAIKALMCLGIVIFVILNLIYSYGINQSIYFNLQQFLSDYVRNNW